MSIQLGPWAGVAIERVPPPVEHAFPGSGRERRRRQQHVVEDVRRRSSRALKEQVLAEPH